MKAQVAIAQVYRCTDLPGAAAVCSLAVVTATATATIFSFGQEQGIGIVSAHRRSTSAYQYRCRGSQSQRLLLHLFFHYLQTQASRDAHRATRYLLIPTAPVCLIGVYAIASKTMDGIKISMAFHWQNTSKLYEKSTLTDAHSHLS